MDKIRSLYLKHKEVVNYLFFGGATTVVSWLTYALFVGPLALGVMPGKILSWICAVSFAFVTNKLWVFDSKSWTWPLWLREAAAFFAGRLGSGLVEIGGLPLLIKLGLDQTLFGVEGFVANIVISVVVIILNYFISKFLVFRKKQDPSGPEGKS